MQKASLLKRSLFHLCFAASLLRGLQCASTSIPVLIPKYPEQNGRELRAVLEGHRTIAVVAAKATAEEEKQLGKLSESWGDTLEASISQALTKLGYYKLIDIGSRKTRLKEVAYSQSGLTKESLEIGRELQAQSLFVVRMTKAPVVQCKIEEVEDYTTTAIAIAVRSVVVPDAAGSINTGRKTGVLYTSIFVEGKVSNISTGRSVSHLYSKSMRMPSEAGNRVCASPEAAYTTLLQEAGEAMALHLSPKIVKLAVPLMKNTADLKRRLEPKMQAEIMAQLESGIKWAQSGSMEEAKPLWQRAWENSRRSSGAAAWNLGVYYWQMDDSEQAEEYFAYVKKERSSMLDHKKRKILIFFAQERKDANEN